MLKNDEDYYKKVSSLIEKDLYEKVENYNKNLKLDLKFDK